VECIVCYLPVSRRTIQLFLIAKRRQTLNYFLFLGWYFPGAKQQARKFHFFMVKNLCTHRLLSVHDHDQSSVSAGHYIPFHISMAHCINTSWHQNIFGTQFGLSVITYIRQQKTDFHVKPYPGLKIRAYIKSNISMDNTSIQK
jgi:hypothetical protein